MLKLKKNLLRYVGAVAVLAVPLLTFAQDSGGDGSQKPTAEIGTENSSGLRPKTIFGAPFTGHWSFTATTTASADYDDNVFSSDTNRQSDITSRFSLLVSAAVQKKRLRFQAHYFPDYVLYRRYSDRNAWTHQFGQSMSYKVSARTNFTWDTSASRSASSNNTPFTIVNFDGEGVPIFHPQTLQTDTIATSISNNVSLSHRLSARNTVSVSSQGNYIVIQSTNGVPLLTFLSNKSFSSGVKVDWETEVVAGRKIGVQVEENYLGFLNPASHSHFQAVKARYSQSFGRGFHFSVGAGPSRREDQFLTGGATPNIDFAMDATMGKSADRYSFGANYNRGSQLGLTQGNLSSDSVSVFATRRFRRKWNASTSFSYSRSISAEVLQQSTGSWAPNGSIAYAFSPELSGQISYAYVNQSGFQGPLGGLGFDRNLFTVGLRYNFSLLKGR